MKINKFFSLMLVGLFFAISANCQTPTTVYSTNGMALFPSTTHVGKVVTGLDYNGTGTIKNMNVTDTLTANIAIISVLSNYVANVTNLTLQGTMNGNNYGATNLSSIQVYGLSSLYGGLIVTNADKGIARGTNDNTLAMLYLNGQGGSMTNKASIIINRSSVASGDYLEGITGGITNLVINSLGQVGIGCIPSCDLQVSNTFGAGKIILSGTNNVNLVLQDGAGVQMGFQKGIANQRLNFQVNGATKASMSTNGFFFAGGAGPASDGFDTAAGIGGIGLGVSPAPTNGVIMLGRCVVGQPSAGGTNGMLDVTSGVTNDYHTVNLRRDNSSRYYINFTDNGVWQGWIDHTNNTFISFESSNALLFASRNAKDISINSARITRFDGTGGGHQLRPIGSWAYVGETNTGGSWRVGTVVTGTKTNMVFQQFDGANWMTNTTFTSTLP